MKVSLPRAPRALVPSLLLTLFGVGVVGGVCLLGAAEPPRSRTDARTDAHVDEEIGRIRAKLFERVDYPLLMRRIDADLELTKAEIKAHDKVLYELERLHRMAHESKPFLFTIEELKLKRLAAELRLDNLEEERCLLQKYQRDERRLRELEARREVNRMR